MGNQALDTFGSKAVTSAKLARQLVAKLTDESAPEDWIIAESQVKEVGAFCRELSAAFREAFADRLHRLGDIELGDQRFYAGEIKKTKRTVSAGDLFEALFTATGGDIDAVKRCLSGGQQVWKQSEVREVAPEVHEASFETETVIEPKTGKPKREPRLTR